jgi:hypothetical protein
VSSFQERFQHIRATLLPFLKSCGFKEAALQWLPAVGPLGENLASPPTNPALTAWWEGHTVVGAIDAFAPKQRNTGKSPCCSASLGLVWEMPRVRKGFSYLPETPKRFVRPHTCSHQLLGYCACCPSHVMGYCAGCPSKALAAHEYYPVTHGLSPWLKAFYQGSLRPSAVLQMQRKACVMCDV